MPIIETTIKQLTDAEVSAVNTTAALVATVISQDQQMIEHRLEALRVAFRGFKGSWSYTLLDAKEPITVHVSYELFWASRSIGNELETDFYVRAVVADNLKAICLAFTEYLDLLVRKQQGNGLP